MIEKMKWEGFIFVKFKGCGCKAKVWHWEGREVLPDRTGYKNWRGSDGVVIAPCERHKGDPIQYEVEWDLVVKALKTTFEVDWAYRIFASILEEVELPYALEFFVKKKD